MNPAIILSLCYFTVLKLVQYFMNLVILKIFLPFLAQGKDGVINYETSLTRAKFEELIHDLLEDTDISYEDICDSFGEKIAGCVLAVTFDSKITDKLEQARKMFLNCIKFGNEALIVKCADLLDNIKYVNLVADVDVKNNLFKKYDMFLEMSKQYIGNEKIYSMLENEVQKQKEV